MGNICRSPTAEGVFRYLVNARGVSHRFEIDSAGTHAYHVGEAPDRRSQQAARLRGIDLSGQRARAVCDDDFYAYDLILAMDEDNFADLQRRMPTDATADVRLFLEFAPTAGIRSVPDPYYGAGDGFERVLDLVELAAEGLLTHLRPLPDI